MRDKRPFFQSTYQTISATKPREEVDEDEEEETDFWQGNLNRKLWKTSCTRAALNVRSYLSHRPIDNHTRVKRVFFLS